MPGTILTPTNTTFPASATGPADGDLANAASVNGAFQALVNGEDAARRLLYGAKLRPRYKVVPGSNGPVNPKITVDPLGALAVTSGGVWTVLTHTTSTTIDILTAFGAGALAVKTRYYLYAYTTDGVTISWLVSATGPDSLLRYMTGSTDYAFIGTFLTDAGVANQILPCYSYGSMHKLSGAGGNGAIKILASGASAVDAAVPLNPAGLGMLVPVWAPVVWLQIDAQGGGAVSLSITPSATSTFGYSIDFNAAGRRNAIIPIVSEDNQNIHYTWGAGGSLVDIYVVGWEDPR